MLKFVTSADVAPEAFADWYIVNTWLQKHADSKVHLDIPVGYSELQARIDANDIDIIYASPYDAGVLVREKGFIPIAYPKKSSDEVVVVVSEGNDITDLASIPENSKIALTENREMKLVGMMLIEPSNLNADNVTLDVVESDVLVAKKLIQHQAEIGFLPARAFDNFSHLLSQSLRVLVRSEIEVMHHCLMIKPHVLDEIPNFPDLIVDMHLDKSISPTLGNLDITQWVFAPIESVEFMIDLMETMR